MTKLLNEFAFPAAQLLGAAIMVLVPALLIRWIIAKVSNFDARISTTAACAITTAFITVAALKQDVSVREFLTREFGFISPEFAYPMGGFLAWALLMWRIRRKQASSTR